MPPTARARRRRSPTGYIMLVAADRALPPATFKTVLNTDAAHTEATPRPAITPSSEVATSDPPFPRRMTIMKLTKQRGKKLR